MGYILGTTAGAVPQIRQGKEQFGRGYEADFGKRKSRAGRSPASE